MTDLNYHQQASDGWNFQYEVDLYGSSTAKDESSSTKVASVDGNIKLSFQKQANTLNKKLLLIVMVDKSRSIQTAWNQIQSTLLNLMSSVLSNTDMEIIAEIIFFNNTSFRLNWNKDNYKQLILAEKPSGKTCFASAFGLCGDIIREFYKAGSEFKSDRGTNEGTDCSIVFLTDGSHTSARDHKKAFKDLQNLIDLVKNVSFTVHTMGFTPNSRFNDLDGIRRLLGTKPGIYQYAESTDGLYALKDKLSFIFNLIFTTSDNLSAEIEIQTPGIKFIDNESNKKTIQLIFDNNGTSHAQLGIYCPNATQSLETIEITLNLGKGLFKTNCTVTPKLNFGQQFQYFAALTRLDYQLNSLLDQIKQHKDEATKPSQAQKDAYLKSILHYQNILSEDFDNNTIMKFPSIIRSDIANLKKSCQDVSSKFLEIINSWNRDTWSNDANQKLADIGYQFVFKNSGRQRRASQKVARNIKSITSDSQKQKELEVNLDVFEDIEDEEVSKKLEASKQLFSCILSLSDWVELLEEKDVLGFGLSIQRPESVIDDPTQLRINEVSTTFLGKSSIEDAISLAIDVHGQEKITGGFQVGGDKTNAPAAVKGRGREPINAWLPLYLHAEHWGAIKYQLKNIIAYFVTLDPLAFSYDQINSIFLVLGSMISKDDIGERQLFLIFQLIRTLKEIVKHLNFIPRIKQQLKSMFSNSIYLVSEQPKNLFVLICYCLVLSNEDLNEIFEGKHENWLRFWQLLLEGTIRRSFYSVFNQWEQYKVDSFLSDIFYGLNTDTENPNISPDTTTDENLSTDDLMDLLLGYKYEDPKIENFDYNAFLKVQKMDLIADDKRRTNPHILNRAKMNPILKISQLIEHHGYPTCSSLLNIMKFTQKWRSMYKDESIFNEIDDRFGIPPESWVSDMKEALKLHPSCTKNSGLAAYMYTANQLYGKCLSNEMMIQQIRAMISQCVIYRINRYATGAVQAGAYTNTFVDPVQCQLVILKQVNDRHYIEVKKLAADIKFSAQTQSALKSTDLASFIKTIPGIGNSYFKTFLFSFHSPNHITFAQQKFTMVLSNIYLTLDDFGVFSGQKINVFTWDCGKRYRKLFIRYFGEETFRLIFRDSLFHRYLFEKQNSELHDVNF